MGVHSSAGIIIFLVALFLAVLGATVFVVVMRRGAGNERQHEED